MEFRVVKLGPFTVQVAVLPEVKLLAIECNGAPVPVGDFPLADQQLLDWALREIKG